MPEAHEILAGLSRIANEAFVVAVLWHAAVGAAAVAVTAGARPSRRGAAGMLVVPFISVSALAWAFGNPFNGSMFAVLSAVLAFVAARGSREAVELGERWAVALGLGLVAFAWVYPHFLLGRSATAYLYGAPLGIIPCPTLALVIGATLIGRGLSSTPWVLGLALAGAFYALFGLLRLGVALDAILLAGVAGLLAQWVRRPEVRRPEHGDAKRA